MVNRSTLGNDCERIPGPSPGRLRTRWRSCHLWGPFLSQSPSRVCPSSIMIRTNGPSVNNGTNPQDLDRFCSVVTVSNYSTNITNHLTRVVFNVMWLYNPARIPTRGCDGSLDSTPPHHWSLMGRPATYSISCVMYNLLPLAPIYGTTTSSL